MKFVWPRQKVTEQLVLTAPFKTLFNLETADVAEFSR